MAALPTNPTRFHAAHGACAVHAAHGAVLVFPIHPESPPITRVFSYIFHRDLRSQVFVEYNMELAQRGLIALQIPGGENAQIVGKDQITEIVRLDLFLRVCEAVRSRREAACSRLGLRVDISIPALALTTRNYFNALHTLNVEHSHNIRGEVNFRYNQLLLRNSVNVHEFVPILGGRNLEELGLGGYEGRLATPLHTKWYAKAFADVVGERDCYLRSAGLSEDESIMDRLGTDPMSVIFSYLSPRDLAVSKGVCKAWCVEARGLEQHDAIRPIIGPIEAQFPSYQVIGPQFWAELKAMPSDHPDSADHPGETIGAFLMRKSDECIAQAAALENPDEAQRLRCRAEGYMLNCKGTWTRSQVVSYTK